MNNLHVVVIGLIALALSILIASWLSGGPDDKIKHTPTALSERFPPLEEAYLRTPASTAPLSVPPTIEPEPPHEASKAVITASSTNEMVSQATMPIIDFEKAKAIYVSDCFVCHETGGGSAPVRGDSNAWPNRLAKKTEILLDHVINGFNEMPAKGGNPALSDSDAGLALAYLIQANP